MQHETMMEPGAPDSTTIVTKCGMLEDLTGKAHEMLTELEAKISPVLHQEGLEAVRGDAPKSVTESASVVSLRLGTIEFQLMRLIERLQQIAYRSEV